MPKTEDGEFELILGNRQLLSVFFIVVVLLGVFFTMGYIVGRNSAPAGADGAAKKNESPPIVVDSAAQSPAAAPQSSSAPPPSGQKGSPAVVLDEPKPRVEPQSQPAVEAKSAEPPPAENRKPAPASAIPGEPQPGATYLQVTAVAKAEAQLFVDVLARRGFHALYVQHPQQPQIFRVLVGPFSDASAVAQARADLNKAGFKGFDALVRKF